MLQKSKIALIAASALLAGSLLGGMAYAATTKADAPAAGATLSERAAARKAEMAERLAQAVTDGKISQAQADLMMQLGEQRLEAMTKLKADAQALIDQAVADGKITQEQAEKLQAKPGPLRMGKRGQMMQRFMKGARGFGRMGQGAPTPEAAPAQNS